MVSESIFWTVREVADVTQGHKRKSVTSWTMFPCRIVYCPVFLDIFCWGGKKSLQQKTPKISTDCCTVTITTAMRLCCLDLFTSYSLFLGFGTISVIASPALWRSSADFSTFSGWAVHSWSRGRLHHPARWMGESFFPPQIHWSCTVLSRFLLHWV